jgi:hypothetical protein
MRAWPIGSLPLAYLVLAQGEAHSGGAWSPQRFPNDAAHEAKVWRAQQGLERDRDFVSIASLACIRCCNRLGEEFWDLAFAYKRLGGTSKISLWTLFASTWAPVISRALHLWLDVIYAHNVKHFVVTRDQYKVKQAGRRSLPSGGRTWVNSCVCCNRPNFL